MSTPAYIWYKIATGIILTAIGILLLIGCTPGTTFSDVAWGKPAVLATDANGVLYVHTQPVPGLVEPILEVLGIVLGAFGFPALALWVRAVSKGAQATATLLAATPTEPTDPPKP